MNETIKTILNRRSTRVFAEGNLTEQDIKTIVEAGIYSPSAMNQQPWHFAVIQNKELLDELSYESKETAKKSDNDYINKLAHNENFHIFYNAPVGIVVSVKEDAYEGEVDCAAATENMLLAAESLNIGSCWIGYISFLFSLDPEKSKKYAQRLGIPEGYKPLHAIALGQKKNNNAQAPKRKENTVSYVK
ncbi:MAG: nitroreductase family protein [Peptostreptococcaceae bacterium]